ncbi:DUF7793 family protein [Aurantibacillus circumpalustris]|uniref:DUF7793 family protein n=1 Tax=Aurantibacillus circumpalustris TaxID=3036359 RepID=UPI00295B2FED|nr:hypothetical protein [Aurantibacillus circumpalustris]
MITTPIELPFVTIYYEEPVIVFNYKPDTLLGVPELKKIVAVAENLSEGKPYVTFSDVRSTINMTEQAKKFLADPKNMPLFRGSAILVSTTLFSFAVNFALSFSKKTYPIKAFVTEEKASEWLRLLSLEDKVAVFEVS